MTRRLSQAGELIAERARRARPTGLALPGSDRALQDTAAPDWPRRRSTSASHVPQSGRRRWRHAVPAAAHRTRPTGAHRDRTFGSRVIYERYGRADQPRAFPSRPLRSTGSERLREHLEFERTGSSAAAWMGATGLAQP